MRRIVVGAFVVAGLASVREGQAAARPTCIAAAELRSANPVWGGHNMFLTAHREIWMQIIEPSGGKLVDRRYHRSIPASDVAELGRVIDRIGFMKMKDATRDPAPDEMTWLASLETCGRRRHSVFRFARDAEAGFQDLVAWFQQTASPAVTGTPAYEGAPDFGWKPPAGETAGAK
jgi:hypothetical protein